MECKRALYVQYPWWEERLQTPCEASERSNAGLDKTYERQCFPMERRAHGKARSECVRMVRKLDMQ